MENDNEDIVKYHQNKRRKHKIKLARISMSLIVISIIVLVIYGVFNKGYFINYKENSEVSYIVNLMENEFYTTDHLEEGTDVISNLIKSIDVEFKYNLDMSEEIEYTYNYKILAETEVKEKSKTRLIYENQREILNNAEQEGKSNKLEIVEKININYNEYNDEINKLLDVYELRNTTSEVYFNLYLNVINKSTGEKINKEEKVMSIQMPLTTKTVEISANEKSDAGQILVFEGKLANAEYVLVIGVVLLIAGFIVLVMLIKYILDTRSAEKMYDDELKRILFDYKSYIQKVKYNLDYYGYKVVKVNTFNEFFSMREEIQSPILMYNEENVKRTFFVMTNENLLFEFILSADLIREDLIQKSRAKENKKNGKNK